MAIRPNLDRSPLERRFLPVVVLALLSTDTLASGCDGTSRQPEMTAAAQIALALPSSSDFSVKEFAWTVLSASGAVLVSGQLGVDDSNHAPAILVTVPAGVGERVKVTAVVNDGIPCTGTSAPFNVTDGQKIDVRVDVVCGASSIAGDLGSLRITANVALGDSCPTLISWWTSAGSDNGTIDVGAVVRDPDPADSLVFAWTATAGAFEDPAAPATKYVCSPGAAASLTVGVSDDHAPLPCSLLIEFPPITCP